MPWRTLRLNLVCNQYAIYAQVFHTILATFTNPLFFFTETVQQIKEVLDTSSKKASELNQEFDLVGKAKSLTSAAADLSDKAIDTVDEANKKYDFVKVAKDTTAKVIDAAKEQGKSD